MTSGTRRPDAEAGGAATAAGSGPGAPAETAADGRSEAPAGNAAQSRSGALARTVAETIVAGFVRYNDDFREITRRAQRRFEQRDWAGNRRDAVERIELYERSVMRSVGEVCELLGEREHDRDLWEAIKTHYAERIEQYPDPEFFKTFFSSITRRVFATIGVDPKVEFIALDVTPTEHMLELVQRRVYVNRGDTQYLFDELLADFSFAVPYRDTERTLEYLSAEVDAYCASRGERSAIERIEILESVFYRSTRAYLVGSIDGNDWVSPLVVALKNTDEGIIADAVILSENDVSQLFGFTRSYFHADIEIVGATVAFLRSILPRKPIAEIYTVLGRAKQGKTERFRSFLRHFQQSEDRFTHAAGDRGMVMEVFTLPSYDIVFKVIRDKFAYPKSIARKDVIEKYQLVFKHDRAGRLVDAQEFRRLEFDRSRFEPELLEDLLTECADTCRIDGQDVVIEHVYLERRLAPLNLYLKEAEEDEARAAVIDYGQAIRDLAYSNIFAGDLLLKNFGLSRHGRVIFYDYDELCLVTDCNFRVLPEPTDEMDEMRADAWFYVGPNDIFPEQFLQFLGFSDALKEVFLEHHGELLTAAYWQSLKRRLEAGEVLEVVPYSPKSWTEHRGPGLYASRGR